MKEANRSRIRDSEMPGNLLTLSSVLTAVQSGRTVCFDNLSEIAVRPSFLRAIVEPGSLDHYFIYAFEQERQPLIARLTLKEVWKSRAELYGQLARLAN